MTNPDPARARRYRAARILRGSQAEVARKLGVHSQTISNRERRIAPITREAERAMESLPVVKKRENT